MIYPNPGSRTNKNASKAAESAGFSGRRLAEARSVRLHSLDLAQSDVIKKRVGKPV
jgi:hypothetical protein